jgi:DnaJ-class molecular chaperone
MSLDKAGKVAGVRERRLDDSGVDFAQIKDRMARWSQRLERDDPYATLGVAPDAQAEDVRERYRELARQHHPDHGGSPAEMRRVNEAYERIRRRAK